MQRRREGSAEAPSSIDAPREIARAGHARRRREPDGKLTNRAARTSSRAAKLTDELILRRSGSATWLLRRVNARPLIRPRGAGRARGHAEPRQQRVAQARLDRFIVEHHARSIGFTAGRNRGARRLGQRIAALGVRALIIMDAKEPAMPE